MNRRNKRQKFLRFLAKRIFKVPEGCIIPKQLKILMYILLPIKSYLYYNNKINYDFMTDCYTIDGCVLPSLFIEEFKNPNGKTWYRFWKDDFGCIMVERKRVN